MKAFQRDALWKAAFQKATLQKRLRKKVYTYTYRWKNSFGLLTSYLIYWSCRANYHHHPSSYNAILLRGLWCIVRRRLKQYNLNDASYLKPKSGITEIHLMTLFIAVFGTVGWSHFSLHSHPIKMQCNVLRYAMLSVQPPFSNIPTKIMDHHLCLKKRWINFTSSDRIDLTPPCCLFDLRQFADADE